MRSTLAAFTTVAVIALAAPATANTIGVYFLTNRDAGALGWRPGQGAVVDGVAPGGPGAAARIGVHDVVKAIEGMPVRDVLELVAALESVPPGTVVRLHVYCGHGRGMFTAWVRVLASQHQQRPSNSAQAYPVRPAPPAMAPNTVINPYTGMPDANLAYAAGLNAIVADANRIADDAIRSNDPQGRCAKISTWDPAYAQCVNEKYHRKDPNLAYGQAWMGSVFRLEQQINEGERLAQDCSRGVPGACAKSQRHLAEMQARVHRDAAFAATLGGMVASSRITNSITRMEQARSWRDFTRRADAFSQGYAEWAAAAARNGREDLAENYSSAAEHWAQAANIGR
jgi:hypothetical protein